MQSGNTESFLNLSQKAILIIFFTLLICFILIIKNLVFKPTFILKKFGELSIDPEIAFTNNKPTFLEFYAEWCEVCKEMAPKIASLKDEYEKDINFVFLNVDNQKWDNYIRKFDVNGIPQVNLFDREGNLKSTFIGKQEESIIRESIFNLKGKMESQEEIFNSDFSSIKNKKNNEVSPRSHG